MINWKKGDLLESNCTFLVNTVNCVGVMGKGIALQFKNKYPKMFEDYKKVCKQKGIILGKIWVWQETTPLWDYKDNLKIILNFPTKYHWIHKSKIEWIESGLKYFVNNYKRWESFNPGCGFAFPKLGCNNGGLDWETQVKPLMIKYLDPLPTRIDIYI